MFGVRWWKKVERGASRTDSRIARHPWLSFPRGKEVSFRFNGRPVRAYEGETVGAALHAAGVRILSRSVKYRRPRGLLCLAGNCPNCLVRVDGVPNVRACVEPLWEGLEVETQVGWPSAQLDAFAVLDRLGFLFPLGFQYRRVIRPRRLYLLWERLLRHMAGHGALPEGGPSRRVEPRLDVGTDVAVVGGGPAGLAAARAACAAGVRVALIDEGDELGGSLRADTARYGAPEPFRDLRGFEIAARLRGELTSRDGGLEVFREATAFGAYEGGVIGVRQRSRVVKLTARGLIVATGAYERPLVAEDWDRPGVFLAGGVQRLLHRWGVRPGEAAAVIGTNDSGPAVAAQLLEAGVDVKALADSRVSLDEKRPDMEALRRRGVPILTLHTLKAVRGRPCVRAVVLARIGEDGQAVPGTDLYVPCDTVVLAAGLYPANELVFHATARGSYMLEASGGITRIPHREDDMGVEDGLYVAGNAAGVGDLEKALLEGEIAGLSAALALGAGGEEAQRRREQARAALSARGGGV